VWIRFLFASSNAFLTPRYSKTPVIPIYSFWYRVVLERGESTETPFAILANIYAKEW